MINYNQIGTQNSSVFYKHENKLYSTSNSLEIILEVAINSVSDLIMQRITENT